MHRRRTYFVSVLLLAMVSTSGFGLLAFAPAASASHETVDWSREWRFTFDARWQLNPATVTDGAGRLYMFYYDLNPSTGQTNISMWRYATRGPSGNPVSQIQRLVNPTLPNTVVTTDRYGFPWSPSVARDHNGALYVAWADTSWDIYVSKSTDNGSSWGAPARVDLPPAAAQDSAPVIVATPSGTLYVAWIQLWFVGSVPRALTIARSVDQGATWGGRMNLTVSTTTVDYLFPSLAVDTAGRLHFAYLHAPSGPLSGWDANYTRSDDGTTWTPPIRLDTGTTYGIDPKIVVDASDRVHVAWRDGRQSSSGTDTYWYRRSNDRGLSWTMEMPISQGRFAPPGLFNRLMLSVSGNTVIAGWPIISPPTFAYAVSWDGGDLWTPEAPAELGTSAGAPSLAVDENGTFYSAFHRTGFDASYTIWDGPPSAPSVTGIARGTSSLTVSWSGSPEGDVMGYRLWRSSDGVTYEIAGTFGSTARQYTDSGLENGTYWYRVSSFDSRGTSSHPSDPASASVGKSLQERIDDLETALGSAQADLNAIQAEIDAIQAQLTDQDAALQLRIDDLQDRLNAIQAEKATAVQSYLNTFLIIIVIILLALMYMQARKKERPQILSPIPPGPQLQSPPPAPPTPPSPPKSEPSMFEEEL